MVSEKIKEAVQKCNPQKAVYALADLVDDYQGAIDRAQTTADQAQQTAETAQETADTALANANAAKTESAAANAAATKAEADAANALTTADSAAADASEAAENALDAMTQAGEALRASAAATTTANEALSVAQAADTLAGKAQNRANEAYAYAGDVDNKVIQTNVDLNNLKTATNSALIGITAPTNTSTVTLDLERIVGTDNVPLPVASATQAGVLNANDYKQLQDYAGRIGALEGSLAIYPVTLPSDNPSSEQITNAYTSQYPDAPNPPLDNTTVSDVQRKITYRYTSIGNTWIQVSYEVTQQFTNSSPGTIKGSTSAGMISANADGTGSLNGYDALNSGVAGSLSEVTAEGTATAVNLVTTKNNGTQTVVTLPQASNTQGGTISAVDYQKLQNSGVPIFTNDALGAIKGSTEDGKISANADGTGSLNGYTELKSKTDLIGTSTIQSPLQIQTNPQNVTIAWTEGGSGLRSSRQIPSVNHDGAGVLSVQQYHRYENSIKEISVSQQPTEIKINGTRHDGVLKTSATITPVSDTQAGVMTPEMLAKLNSAGPAMPFLDIVINGPTVVTPTGNLANTYQIKNLTNRIATGLTRYRDIFWFTSGTALIYRGAPDNPGSGNYNIGNVQLATVMSSVQNAINKWNAHWYGGSELYMRFKVYVGSYNGSVFELRYEDTQFPDGDPWLSTVLIKITSSGIELMETARNPLLEPSSAVDVSENATNWVLYLDYLGTSAP